MDSRTAEVEAIVKKLKDGAQAAPWIPAGAPPRERYHRLPDGLKLCLTRDIFPKEYLDWLDQAYGAKLPRDLVGSQFWHLSIARLGARGPTPEEVEFWCRAFFEEAPLIKEVPGLITGVNSRHFFWRAE